MKQRKWKILSKLAVGSESGEARSRFARQLAADKLINLLLENRGISSKKDKENFLHPPDPYTLTAEDIGIDQKQLKKAINRIQKAIVDQESIVVYADYDADGVTAGTVMWETLHKLGAKVAPYIPHRVDEGYGFSVKGIDNVKAKHKPTLIVSVDHGVTAWEKIAYAKNLGIDVIVTDHHVLPIKLPNCTIVHTTQLAGAGVAWFVAKELISSQSAVDYSQFNIGNFKKELLALVAIGTIGDMVPLTHANRSIAKYGLDALNETERIGLKSLFENTGLELGNIGTYEVSFMIVPRLNAMGRIVHALDAMRLLCAPNVGRARELAQKLSETNRDRQKMTIDATFHAKEIVALGVKSKALSKILFIAHEEYNQGVIGLVAGKLVEEFYRPAIVVAIGERYSKASARSISGFNIIEAIRSCSELLIDCGGHPMAAGFTFETQKLVALKQKLETLAEAQINAELLTRILKIDTELDLKNINMDLWRTLVTLEPFGMGNPQPIFATRKVIIQDARLVGVEGKHLKLMVRSENNLTIKQLNNGISAIGFGMGKYCVDLKIGQPIDIAYSLDLNEWNGRASLQLKLKDIRV